MAKKQTINQKTMNQIALMLAHFLSNNFVLYVKTLNFHWNMAGPQFFMYHKLLEHQYEELAKANDDLAERIRMLGGLSPGSMKELLSLAGLKESKSNLSWQEMIQDLVASHEAMIEECHHLIEFTDQKKDQGTSDLIIERIRFHDKQAWLLRSHLIS